MIQTIIAKSQQFSLRSVPGVTLLCEWLLSTTFRGLSQIPSSAGKAAPTRLSFPKKELLAELFLFGLRLHRSMDPISQ